MDKRKEQKEAEKIEAESTNEEIFLDNTQALLAVELISQSMKIGLEYVIKIYQEAITEAEEIWENGIQLANALGTTLTYSDILSALEAGGVTKYSVVFQPTAYYRDKIANALEIEVNFNQLAAEIKASIEEVEQTEHMKKDVLELTKEKQKELAKKIEKCDENYYRTLRKLKENKQ